MKTRQHHFIGGVWNDYVTDDSLKPESVQLVFVFGAPATITNPDIFNHLRSLYPVSNIVFSSTSGEILNDNVFDDSAVVTAIEFEKTNVKCVSTGLPDHKSSYETGLYLMQSLAADDLNSVFVISDGTYINGSELVAGFNDNNIRNVQITGGLAGDAGRFEKTFTGLNEAPTQGNVIAVGFYGTSLAVGHGSFGGWDEFGHERTITKSAQNVLYEIDNRNALDLYKEYLGTYADELPGSALLFPLALRGESADEMLVRTILAVNETEKSMTFAGNLPEGSKVRLMKANFDKLIEGSSNAATHSFTDIKNSKPDLAILISCVGRRLILQERTYEELEAAKGILGADTAITGFYSYGELSPFNPTTKCELHNQTMTITTFSEK